MSPLQHHREFETNPGLGPHASMVFSAARRVSVDRTVVLGVSPAVLSNSCSILCRLFCCVSFLLVCLGSLSTLAAAPIQPFDAVVQDGTDDAFVRSGPGNEHHYATLKLAPGDKVHVLRKDPGGWYMIDPPPGSYSWIIAKYVQRNGNQGTVTETGVVVRVGAEKSTQRDVEQVRLNKGDQVEILGEDTLDSDRGREKWLKIKPPRGEHRWIKGSHLVELNPDGTPKVLPKHTTKKPPRKPDTDDVEPSTNNIHILPHVTPKGPSILKDPELGTEKSRGVYGHPPGKDKPGTDPFSDLDEAPVAQSEEAAIREDLVLLDQELQDILKKPAKDWNLSNQFEDLRALKEMAGKSPLVPQIDQRLARLDKLQKTHEDAEYIFRKLQADQRAPGSVPGDRVARDPAQSPGTSAGGMIPNAQGIPNAPAVPRPRFEGAGIVHRLPNAQPGLPRYVIAAPDRRILCYLDSEPGIDLDRYVGQSMGLNGPRSYDPRLRADRMRVQKLTPVRLAP